MRQQYADDDAHARDQMFRKKAQMKNYIDGLLGQVDDGNQKKA